MKQFKSGFNILIILLTVLFLVIFLTINLSPLYYWCVIKYFHLNRISELSGTSLMKCYFFMLKYLQIPWDTHLNLVFFKSSNAGLMHFLNVRHLVIMNNICLVAFGIFSAKIIHQMALKDLLWKLINLFRVMTAGLLILASIAMVNFQNFFINFHRLMFRNQDWVFKANLDPVIRVLPLGFFVGCFVIFVVIFVINLVFVIHLLKNLLTE